MKIKNLKLEKKINISTKVKTINIINTQLLRGVLKKTTVLKTDQDPRKITEKVHFLERLQAGRLHRYFFNTFGKSFRWLN